MLLRRSRPKAKRNKERERERTLVIFVITVNMNHHHHHKRNSYLEKELIKATTTTTVIQLVFLTNPNSFNMNPKMPSTFHPRRESHIRTYNGGCESVGAFHFFYF